MISFLNLKPTAFGLDISDRSLKIIRLKKSSRSFELISSGETIMKPGIIEQGDIKNEKALSAAIKEAVKNVCGEKIRTKRVVISLPEEKTFLQVIQLPVMKEEEVQKAVYFEAENYIPLPIGKVYLDSQIISCDAKTNKLNVLIAAMPKTIVDSYVSALKGAALEPVVLEIESMSIARALIKNNNADSRALILIDLGENRTNFSIFLDQSLKFTTTSQISAKNFSEIIAQSLKINSKEAEALKIKHGIGNSKSGKKNAEILNSALVDFIDLSQKYINYCQTQYNQKAIKILLCGGGANLKGLPDFLHRQLKIPVERGNPWTNITFNSSKRACLSDEESLKHTTAIGLALRGIQL
ncbi:MAG: type IV pilus assembly protein PilM [Candidatus Nealsonbacteria bacterium]